MTDSTRKHDAQDPLPETNWFWRRVYTFVLSLVSVGLIWYGVEALHRMGDAKALYSITRYLIGVLVILITYYMVAPSAEQIVKLIQAAKLLRVEAAQPQAVPRRRRADTPPAPEEEEQDFAPRSRS